jgi:hypothetical protein
MIWVQEGYAENASRVSKFPMTQASELAFPAARNRAKTM